MLRFATAPTGDMSIGSLRVAILSYLLAQQRQEPFGIRIDDLDKSKVIEGKDTEIMQILEKFALVHDTVFHQSEHLHRHQTLAIKLLEEDKAFICTCTSDHCIKQCDQQSTPSHTLLKENKTPFVIRIQKPSTPIIFEDKVQGEVSVLSEDIEAFVILDTQGIPSADFASACDDIIQNVTMLIHEDTHITQSAKQLYIKKQLGFDTPIEYAHIPAMSSKQNDTSVKWFLEQGFIPDALINTLLFVGNPKVPKKVFTLPEAITWFQLTDLSSVFATLDIDTARDINKKHLKKMDDKQLSTLFGFADAEVGKLVKLYVSEASTINELALKIRPIFAPKTFEGTFKEEMLQLQKIILDAPMIHSFSAFEDYLMKKSGLQGERFSKSLRMLLTGALSGPTLSDIYPFIKPYLLEVAS